MVKCSKVLKDDLTHLKSKTIQSIRFVLLNAVTRMTLVSRVSKRKTLVILFPLYWILFSLSILFIISHKILTKFDMFDERVSTRLMCIQPTYVSNILYFYPKAWKRCLNIVLEWNKTRVEIIF